MKTIGNDQSSKPSRKAFIAIDNILTRGTRTKACVKKNTVKENRNSNAYNTFTNEQAHSRVKRECLDNSKKKGQRPTMGGKNVSGFGKAPSKARVSPEELESWSRRVTPNEQSDARRSAPSKPPLASSSASSKKRIRGQWEGADAQPTKMAKANDGQAQLICEPCKKKYKTRKGLAYHLERCKYKLTESKDIVNCICLDATDGNKGSMIECVACNTWLHRKCVGSVTGETNYHCIRCVKKATVDGNLVKFSEIFPKVIEESTECPFISLYFERRPINTPWKDSIIRSCTVGAFNDLRANTPCVLLSDSSLFPSIDLSPSPSLELSSSTLLPGSDWFHFANFEADYYQL